MALNKNLVGLALNVSNIATNLDNITKQVPAIKGDPAAAAILAEALPDLAASVAALEAAAIVPVQNTP